jgi:glutamine cyclotransferase
MCLGKGGTIAALLLMLSVVGCGSTTLGEQLPVYGYRTVAEFDHPTENFTEGLVYEDGVMFEGTGLNGFSKLTVTDLTTGLILASHQLDPRYFGEGVAVLGDEVFQLTYASNIGFVYEKESLRQMRTFGYPFEGWGLTTNGSELIMSDGTAVLRFFEPSEMRLLRSVTVHDPAGPVGMLNELEYIEGEIYANIFQEDLIARISPEDGSVTGWIDLTGLYGNAERRNGDLVLNGIAYDREGKRLFVTGKNWPRIYQIELTPKGREELRE